MNNRIPFWIYILLMCLLIPGVIACAYLALRPTCAPSGFTRADGNVWPVVHNGEHIASVEYNDGYLKLFEEPGHVGASMLYIEHQPFDTGFSIVNKISGDTLVIVDVFICKDKLYVRERLPIITTYLSPIPAICRLPFWVVCSRRVFPVRKQFRTEETRKFNK